jgi:hypothetical protein
MITCEIQACVAAAAHAANENFTAGVGNKPAGGLINS